MPYCNLRYHYLAFIFLLDSYGSLLKQVYSALLDGQVENAISIDDGYSPTLYTEVRPYIIAMPIIQGVAVLVLAYFTYKLFQDFGWEVLHLIGADRKLKVSLLRLPFVVSKCSVRVRER